MRIVKWISWVALSMSGCGQAVYPLSSNAQSQVYYVAANGSDANPGTQLRPFRTIQHGLNVAVRPGDVVRVRAGTYEGGITFPVDGTASRPIVLENYPGERPFISGADGVAQKLVRIFNRSHVRFRGFEVGDLSATSPFESGAIFVEGYGGDIEISGNYVHDVEPKAHTYANGRAIQVRGYYQSRSLQHILVSGNEIDRCRVEDGNVLEISGNSAQVRVLGNRMREDAGIALNITGGTKPPRYTRWDVQVRDVVVDANDVDDTLGAGAIGLYIQAAKDAEVRRNRVQHSSWGLYVTSEYPGVHSQAIVVADNFIAHNAEAGLLIGSPFFPTAVLGAIVHGNTVIGNGRFEAGNGGNFGIGRARDVRVYDNKFFAADDHALTYLGAPYTHVTLNKNCYFAGHHSAATARFGYAGITYTGFSRYQTGTGQDLSSTFGRPCD